MIPVFSPTQITKGMRILLRMDANVVDLSFAEDLRLKRVFKDIEAYLENGATIILLAHKGRPQGVDQALSLRPFIKTLERRFSVPVTFFDFEEDISVYQSEIEKVLGGIILVENIRFWREEEANDDHFAQQLATLGDVYVNNAFSVSHREHASVVGIPTYQSASYLGQACFSEIEMLQEVLKEKEGVFLVGGAKWETKSVVVEEMSRRGFEVFLGSAYVRADSSHMENVYVPVDLVVERKGSVKIVKTKDLQENDRVIDIGFETVKKIRRRLWDAPMAIWNGPVGRVEEVEGREGSLAIMKILETLPEAVVGGGDTIALIQQEGQEKAFSHISLGGGAMLAYLAEGNKLPGIKILERK